MSRYYLTTPIYYVNDVPHIGTSYTTIAADIFARFHRLRGEEVLFVTGTDENAPKVVQAARDQNAEPQAFVDTMAERFQDAWRALNIEPDVFIRTTEARHREAVQTLFARLRERGDIYQGEYEGWYCQSDETYFSADEVVREGEARLCPNEYCRRPLKWVKETNYFFALSRYAERLEAHIEAHPEFLQPEFRRNEVLSFIRAGLRDVCITRAATEWGIPVPDDPSQVVYVWFDALINYATVAGYPGDGERFSHWWPADLHLVGKDIFVRFHCTLWPAMLMAAGMALPGTVFGHGFWMNEGRKISKSLGNMILPLDVAREIADLSGARFEIAVDALRYFLFREVPFGQDGDFTRASVLGRFNADLANDLGNALHRSLSLTARHFGSRTPTPGDEEALSQRAVELHPRITAALEGLNPQGALQIIWEFISAINKYLDDRKPWTLAREGKTAELGAVLYAALDACRVVAIWVSPFMPCAAAEIRRQLGLSAAPAWEDCRQPRLLEAEAALQAPTPIFPRIDRKRMAEVLQKPTEPPAPSAPTKEPTPAPEYLKFDDFARMELVVGRIQSAEPVPKTDRLLKLSVDLGSETRTVLAGIAEHYSPEELTGKRVVLVANLAPRKIRGIESQGMLLAAEADGKVSLLQPDAELPPGAKVL